MWGQHPPSSAVNVVHRYIGALRRLFEPGLPARSQGRWLLGDAAGYRIPVPADQLDLLKLRALAERARSEQVAGRDAEAMSAYEAALALWRGPCAGAAELASYEHLAFSVVDHECADLLREATSMALRLERVRCILPVLRRMAESRPWDEALQAQLLLALSADGHQAEAIALYRTVRRRLADELGVDQGEELREAHQVVLRQGVAGPVEQDVVPSSTTDPPPAGVQSRMSSLAVVLPAQLPADLPWFTGRDEAQRRTLSLVNGHVMTQVSTPVLAIDGIPGIGKTTLAIHLAHQLSDAYPDGQLYVDLQGFDPDQSMLHPAEALQGFLNALGVPDTDIPASHHARSGLYRSVLAGRRILVVLDNAHSVEQVRPLLPGAPGCLVLVTSRKRLTGLATAHGAHLMSLDVPPLEDARAFLTSRIGAARTSVDPQALDEIVERCGRLPLALAVVAGRALAHPDHRLTDIARELRDAQGSLDGFAGDDMDNDIRAIFSWSYRMLGARAARTFRLLSLHPGPDLTIPAIASLAGVPLSEARLLVGELVRTGLLTEHAPGRVTTHDLIRSYAQELVRLHENESDRHEALRRLIHHYQQTAYEANLLLGPTVVLDPPAVIEAVTTTHLGSANEASAWFNADRNVLKSVVQRQIDAGSTAEAWQMVLSLLRFYHREGWWHDWATITRAGLQAVTATGDELGRAHMSRGLAGALLVLGDHDAAARYLRQALELFHGLGKQSEQGLVYRNLGQVSFAQDNYHDSIAYYERALRHSESLNDLPGQATVLCCLADAYTRLGKYDESLDLVHRALAIAEALDDLNGQGLCHETAARCYLANGDLSASLMSWKHAIEIYRRTGWRMNLVEGLTSLGDTELTIGDRTGARAAWQEALDLLRHLRLPQVTEVQNRLARLEQVTAAGTRGGR
ncbi:ATP-binding protein [Actinoplanes solisilvae]|uniref:ATP-binding protein n=1 Tax=Actinoplanes solisilvae TaxID=2486853 RepID=UPI001F0CACF8|nr:BTAD domain-containing putative transcriptional regulator [Actinoplanes solisilvae]